MENYETDRRRDADRACSESLLASLKEHHGNAEKPARLPIVIQEAESDRIAILNGEIAELMLTVKNQRKIIDSLCEDSKSAAPRTSEIVSVVAAYYKISTAQLVGFNRSPVYSFPRSVAYYLARVINGTSYPEIGRRIGDRDHTSIIHGFNKIQARLQTDGILRDDVDVLRAKLDALVLSRKEIAERAAA